MRHLRRTSLVTGGLGILGAEVVHQLLERGDRVVVFDNSSNSVRLSAAKGDLEVLSGDVGNYSEVLNTVQSVRPTTIFHLAAVLGFVSEEEPAVSHKTNVEGTRHVLEAARLCDRPQVMFASSTGSFGLGAGELRDDHTAQRPTILYGVEKLYGEGLGRWYRSRYGIDFRCLRYAQIVGPKCGVCWVWAPAMIEDAIRGERHCAEFAAPHSVQSVLYIRDAARAALELMAAPLENIETVNYNVVAWQQCVEARELETLLRHRYPGFSVRYAQEGQGTTSLGYDDSAARREWGWRPQFENLDEVIEVFEHDYREHAPRFGLTGMLQEKAGQKR